MKLVYEAANNVEAHMVVDMLEREGLSARVDGEYLQGGVGELQTIGIVRVMVEESDYLEAKKVIQAWDEQQSIQTPEQTLRKKSVFGYGVIGFLCGVAVMAVYFHTPVTRDGIDYDGDGKLDEVWTYVNHLMTESKVDRNFDGEADFIYSFNRRGIIKTAAYDLDFNGTFEVDAKFVSGNPVKDKIDTNGDGFKDYEIRYQHGIVKTATFLDPVSRKPKKIQYFSPHKLQRAELDTNGDGVMDTFYEYDSIEEVARVEKMDSLGSQ